MQRERSLSSGLLPYLRNQQSRCQNRYRHHSCLKQEAWLHSRSNRILSP
jgi:hypothetical protein